MQEKPQSNSINNMQKQILKMKRKLNKLKDKNKQQVLDTKKHNSLTKDIIAKKIEMAKSMIQSSKAKQDLSQQQAIRINQLRLKNKHRRIKHANQLNNIMKAVYMVKVDDYRQMKRISENHKNKLQKLRSSQSEQNRIRKQRTRSQGKQQKFWRDKLYRQYLDKHAEKLQHQKQSKLRKRELDRLSKEEQELLNQLNGNRLCSSKSKQEYVGAVSLPVREVVSALNLNKKGVSRSGATKYRQEYASGYDNVEEQTIFPKTEVNEAKLKIILQKLRRNS